MVTPQVGLAVDSPRPQGPKRQFGIQKAEPLALIKTRVIVLHLLTLGVFFVPFAWGLVWLTAATFGLRMLGVECGYHRYFAHRAFKTSRAGQFILAVLAVSSGQRGLLWWASLHRQHHSHADAEGDVHSPRVSGFWYAHMGWALQAKNINTDLDLIPDFARYPELRWLNKFHYVPGFTLMVGLYVAGTAGWLGSSIGGLQAVIWGFFLSTCLVLHTTFAVNSLVHGDGRFGGTRRYATRDASVNHAWLALPTMGGAWHNNHHRYAASAKAGFAWWELDLGYVALRVLAAFGIVWDLRPVPADVLAEGGVGVSRPGAPG